jgi:hypothetical protein
MKENISTKVQNLARFSHFFYKMFNRYPILGLTKSQSDVIT